MAIAACWERPTRRSRSLWVNSALGTGRQTAMAPMTSSWAMSGATMSRSVIVGSVPAMTTRPRVGVRVVDRLGAAGTRWRRR